MAKKEAKTNAMRILERMKIPFEHQEYECDEFTDGCDVADKLGLPYDRVFKTLVTEGSDKEHYVFVIPVDKELDLKKCARAAGVKSVQMIHMKDLFGLTGYVRGGCTAIGMKKAFKTHIQESAKDHEKIYVSGGRVGSQIVLKPDDFLKAAKAETADLIKDA
ncbi:MAG: Cys-tRNA(Pro) deacylase [Lachnospiraceae bacterium]|nr:Cys-tRNA(Pro) deacylase [Lachnospiraceae bacterium]